MGPKPRTSWRIGRERIGQLSGFFSVLLIRPKQEAGRPHPFRKLGQFATFGAILFISRLVFPVRNPSGN
jgi:hypothetical protein